MQKDKTEINIVKVCMECGNEFEDDIHFNNILTCPNCGSGDIHQPVEEDYDERSIGELEEIYTQTNIDCECNADRKQIMYIEVMEE